MRSVSGARGCGCASVVPGALHTQHACLVVPSRVFLLEVLPDAAYHRNPDTPAPSCTTHQPNRGAAPPGPQAPRGRGGVGATVFWRGGGRAGRGGGRAGRGRRGGRLGCARLCSVCAVVCSAVLVVVVVWWRRRQWTLLWGAAAAWLCVASHVCARSLLAPSLHALTSGGPGIKSPRVTPSRPGPPQVVPTD